MLLLLLALCSSLFGSDALMLVLLSVAALLLFTPRASAWLTLRLYRARQLSFEAAPELYRIVGRLAERAGLSRQPLLFYIPASTPNAFAMLEHGQPLIAVSDGLLRQLNEQETVAVLAHEISHIRHGDLEVMMLADMLSRLTSGFALMGWLMLLLLLPLWLLGEQLTLPWLTLDLLLIAPLAARMLQMALSRTREFDADLGAVQLTGEPAALARALLKIEQQNRPWWQVMLPDLHTSEPGWLRTHPSTAERVRRLSELVMHEGSAAVMPAASRCAEHPLAAQYHGLRWYC